MQNVSMADPGTRVVANKNIDTTNIATIEQFLPTITNTLKSCEDILKSHCGPQSGYAMLVESNLNVFAPNRFTRDGIRILKSIDFMSPLEQYIKEMLAYVGERVDHGAKDGTTTSMLFTTVFLQKMLAKRKHIQDLNLSFFQMDNEVSELFKEILDNLDKYKFSLNRLNGVDEDTELSEEDAMHTAGIVAFIQALSSSGGNMELACAMRDIFERSPRISWEFITSHTSIKENGKSFQVEVDEHDAKIKCIAVDDDYMNRALRSEYLEEDVQVTIFPEPLNTIGFNGGALMHYLSNELPKDKAMVIICQDVNTDALMHIRDLNYNREKKITLWQYSPEAHLAGQRYPWELMVISAIAGKNPITFSSNRDGFTEEFTFNADVHWHDSCLYLSNVFEKKEGSLVHPFYDNENAPQFYKDIVEELKKEISNYRDGHKPDGRMFNVFMEMLNKVICVQRPVLRLGGPMHEQVANQDVVQDVQGAIMSSLKHGFLINGPFGILFAVENTYRDMMDNDQIPGDLREFRKCIIEAMSDSLKFIIQTIFTIPSRSHEENIDPNSPKLMREDPELYLNILSDSNKPFTLNGFIENIPNSTTAGTDKASREYPVMQPIVITRELLKRTQELTMKFINTNKIIIYGGVIVNDEEVISNDQTETMEVIGDR